MAALSQQFVKNIFTSSVAFGIRIVLNFFFIPYITFMYGGARYGVWVIIFQTVSYFTLFDCGLNSALTKYVSEYFSKKDFKNINRTLSTANTLYLGIGTIVFIGVLLVARYLFGYFKIDSIEMIAEGKNALTILGLFIAGQFYTMAFGNSHSAFQRHDVIRILNAIEEILRIGVMALLIYSGYGLQALALTILISSLLRSLAGAIWLKKLFPDISFSLTNFDREIGRKLFRYSKITFAISIGWIIMFSSDSFILGLLSSSAAAGIYNPGAQLMLYMRNIINNIGTPLIPAISHLQANEAYERIRAIYLKGLKYVSLVSFVMATGVILYAKSFVALWLDPEFAQTAEVMMILAIGTVFFLPQILGNSVLFGCGKHKYILYVLICEVIGKVLLAFLLIPRWGVQGMALANSIPQVLFYTTLYPLLIGRFLKISYGNIIIILLKTAFPALILTAGSALLLQKYIPVDSWSLLFVHIVIILSINSIYVNYVVEDDDKEILKAFFQRKHAE